MATESKFKYVISACCFSTCGSVTYSASIAICLSQCRHLCFTPSICLPCHSHELMTYPPDLFLKFLHMSPPMVFKRESTKYGPLVRGPNTLTGPWDTSLDRSIDHEYGPPYLFSQLFSFGFINIFNLYFYFNLSLLLLHTFAEYLTKEVRGTPQSSFENG